MKTLKISLLAALVATVSASAHAEYEYRVHTKGVKSATCALPWGGPIAAGLHVTAYRDASVPFGASCVSEERTCTKGTLSGSFTAETCVVSPPPSLQGKVSTVHTKASPYAGFVPSGAAYDPVLNSILTATYGSAPIQTSLDTGVVTSRPSLGTYLSALAVSPSGTLYAANNGSSAILVVDRNTWTTTTLMTIPHLASGMAWSQYDSKLYVLGANSNVLYKVDVAAKTYQTMTLPAKSVDTYGLAVSATTGNIFLYLSSMGPFQVTQAGVATLEGCAGNGYGYGSDPFGNVFFGGYGTHKITRKAPDGTCADLAGSGALGNADGIGAEATFRNPAKPMVTPDGLKVYTLTDGPLRVIE